MNVGAMNFVTNQSESGRWRWLLMKEDRCIGMSTDAFPDELSCLFEIEAIRRSVTSVSDSAAPSFDDEYERAIIVA